MTHYSDDDRFNRPGPLARRRARPSLPYADEPENALLSPVLPVTREGMVALRKQLRAEGKSLSPHFVHQVRQVRHLYERLKAAPLEERSIILAQTIRDAWGIDNSLSDEDIVRHLRRCLRKAREEVARFRDTYIPEASRFLLTSVGKLEAEADPVAAQIELGRMHVMGNGNSDEDVLQRIVAYTLRRDLVLAMRIFDIEYRIRQLGEHVLSWILAARSQGSSLQALLPNMREADLRWLAEEDPLALITHLLTLRFEEKFFVRDKLVRCLLRVAVDAERCRPLRILERDEAPAAGELLREVPFGYRFFRTPDGREIPVAFDPGQKQVGSILWKLIIKRRFEPTDLQDLVRFRLTFRTHAERAMGIRAVSTEVFPFVGTTRYYIETARLAQTGRQENPFSDPGYDVTRVDHTLYGWRIEGQYDILPNYLASVLEKGPINHVAYKSKQALPLVHRLFPREIFGILWTEDMLVEGA